MPELGPGASTASSHPCALGLVHKGLAPLPLGSLYWLGRPTALHRVWALGAWQHHCQAPDPLCRVRGSSWIWKFGGTEAVPSLSCCQISGPVGNPAGWIWSAGQEYSTPVLNSTTDYLYFHSNALK